MLMKMYLLVKEPNMIEHYASESNNNRKKKSSSWNKVLLSGLQDESRSIK